ncbi:hypothetical protein [Rubrivirga sp. IMCC45206]|uniref:hypothetical protein n=1 Tax=Rubrivirga sp. IMCC45206 TaxID=3391614 RepID=UPI00398F9E48
MRAVLVLLLALAACDAPTISGDAFDAIPLAPGISRAELTDDRGATVRLSLSVPAGLAAGERVPLVLALHWAGEVTPYFGETYLRVLAAPGFDEARAIVVAPDRIGGDWETAESRAFAMSLVRRALERWPVDPGRVVVTGYSMGGFGTWLYLEDYDEFAAGIPMAAVPLTDGGGRPTYVIHGTADELYAFQTTQWAVESRQRRGLPIVLAPAEGLGHTEPAAYVPALRAAARWLATDVW